MRKPKVLLISDPNLGPAAHDRLSQVCEDLTWYCWASSAERDPDSDSRATMERGGLVLQRSDPAHRMPGGDRLPLNVHPALPHIRGVAHDVPPRWWKAGATLHHRDRADDSGRIYDVLEAPLPPGQTYQSIRALNQASACACRTGFARCLPWQASDRLCKRASR